MWPTTRLLSRGDAVNSARHGATRSRYDRGSNSCAIQVWQGSQELANIVVKCADNWPQRVAGGVIASTTLMMRSTSFPGVKRWYGAIWTFSLCHSLRRMEPGVDDEPDGAWSKPMDPSKPIA
jgi:hypothetical protein